jgi:putative oxidoreductase
MSELAFFALRVVVGFLFMLHGAGKILHFPHAMPMPLDTQLKIGGVIELVGGALVMVGLFTRAAAFICSGMMAVAYFQFHWKGHFDNWMWLPGENHGEDAVIYCFVFLFIAAAGGGALSLDRKLRNVT